MSTDRDKPFFVLLDLDNTILDFDAAERAALSETLREFGVVPTQAVLGRYHELNVLHWELLEEGKLTREQTLTRRFERLFAVLGLACDGAAVNDRYERLLCRGHAFMPGARELLERLRGRYPLYAVSNGNAFVQDARIAGAGLAAYFEDFFISERIGADKPSRAYFDACFAAIPGFDRRRALMVGDSLTSDIRGGINAGVTTCWFNPQKKPGRNDVRPDYEISSLDQLPPLLERLTAEA